MMSARFQNWGWAPLRVAAMALVACLATFAGGCGGPALIQGGSARVAVVLPAEPTPREQLAATELVEHLALMTKVQVPTVTADALPEGVVPIYLGSAADAELDTLSRQAKDTSSAFTVRVTPDRIDIRGLGDQGTLFGVYEVLEQLGFRWYMPGELGRVVPTGSRVRLANQINTQAPTMIWRHLQNVNSDIPWTRHVRLGGDERSTGRHGIPGLPLSAFAENPELFGLNNGQRRPRQDCLSNPEALRRVVAHVREHMAENPDEKYIGMGSHDGGGYCECENCKALDQGVYDPTGDRESMTDRYVWFFNRVLEEVEADYPDLHIVTYAYGAHMMPPAIAANPRIVPVFAPITIDRIRGMDNPMSPDRHLLRWLIDEWAARGVKEMYYRGYYGNLACPTFPLSQIDRIRHETPVFAEKGITVMRVEVIDPSWSASVPTLYVAARMMWNVDTDVDALLDEFYKLYYGPARAAMKQYHEGIESAFRDTPYFAGSSYLYFPIFIGHPRRDKLHALLEDAASAAARSGNDIYARRVAAVRLGWDRMDAFLDMIEARNEHNFAGADRHMKRFDRLTDEGMAWKLEPDLALSDRWHPRLVPFFQRTDGNTSYFNRFFRQVTVQGHQRAVAIGQIVAPLQDEWMFLMDPSESGEIMGLQRPGDLGGGWKPLKTTSRSWSDQGMHFYKGIGWYRQKVTIPVEFQGKPIYLWIGGVDEFAQVWVNGHDLGISRENQEGVPGVPGTFRPFDRNATRAVKFGEENWVVVKVTNKALNELGTGGIVGPVMFWTPNDPNWTPGN